jgi:hypothetical protein
MVSSILATCISVASRSDVGKVNEQHTGGTYADLKIAFEVAERLHKSNAPHTIAIRGISAGVTAWQSPASDQSR